MKDVIDGVLIFHPPEADAVPAIFDSPHSGRLLPADWNCLPGPDILAGTGTDHFIHELFDTAPRHGGCLLEALFHRAYIDLNRADTDIDNTLLAEPWPGPTHASERMLMGKGLIWRSVPPDIQLYDRKLSITEVRSRIQRYWSPYHAIMTQEFDRLQRDYRQVFHFDCHANRTYATVGAPEGEGTKRPEIELGTLHGAASGPRFVNFLRERIETLGFEVVIDGHHPGEYLVRHYGAPAAGRHSVMIEIRKNLYMDETTQSHGPHWREFKGAMDTLTREICEFARSEGRKPPD
jgi:N-formylglutamate deformylase